MYDYGDKVKIVYFRAQWLKKPKWENPLFPEFDGVPPEFRENMIKWQLNPEYIPMTSEPPRISSEKGKGNKAVTKERLSQSISRARSKIFELAMCNEFTHFCTFTQSGEMRDRFDLNGFRKDFAQFVRNINRSRRDNPIKYLLIPEQHLNSRKKENIGAWHMHGLLMGLTEADLRLFSLKEKLPQNIRKALKSGQKVYNWEQYAGKFGYFTCTEIGNQEACAKYITKYITKDLVRSNLENGQHSYFASQGLNRRAVIVKNSKDKCPVTEWDFENEYVKVKWLDVER